MEFNLGGRGCGGDPRCGELRSRGAWGPSDTEAGNVDIPNLNMHFVNNIIANPPDNTTMWVHIAVSQNTCPVWVLW